MEIKLSDYDIQAFAKEGIQKEVSRLFGNSYSGSHGSLITAAVAEGIKANQIVITNAISQAVKDACEVPAFKQVVQKELIEALSKRFMGEFDSVIKAAARQAAQEEIVKQKLLKAMEEAK